jgi:hypothetical protein
MPARIEAAGLNSRSSENWVFHDISEIFSEMLEFIDDAITSRISFATVAFFLRETKTRGFSQPH